MFDVDAVEHCSMSNLRTGLQFSSIGGLRVSPLPLGQSIVRQITIIIIEDCDSQLALEGSL